MQAGVDDVAHAAVQLMRVERDLLDRRRRASVRRPSPASPCGPARSRTPPTARRAGRPTARCACRRPDAARPGTTRSACRTARASWCSRPCARSPPRRRRPGPDSPAPQRHSRRGAAARRRRVSRSSTTTSSKRTVDAANPPIIGTGSTVTPDVVASTANRRPHRCVVDDHVGHIRIGDEVHDTAHQPAVAVASCLQPRRHVGRVPRVEHAERAARLARGQTEAASAAPHAEPVDGQRRINGALNDPGAQCPSRFDAEDPDSRLRLPSISQPEHARVGQRLPLRVRLAARRPARCDTSRPDRVRPERESLACRHRPYDGILWPRWAITSRSTSLVPPPKRISGDTRYSRSKKLPTRESVGPEQVDREVGDPLPQLAGEDLLDADLHAWECDRCRAATRPRSPSAWRPRRPPRPARGGGGTPDPANLPSRSGRRARAAGRRRWSTRRARGPARR